MTYKITDKDIEKLLTKLDYYDLELFGHDPTSNSFSYIGYIDTAYWIHVKLDGTEKTEVWDCVYDEENYVRIATAQLINDRWNIVMD